MVLWDKNNTPRKRIYNFLCKEPLQQDKTVLVVCNLRGFKGDLSPIHELDEIFGFEKTQVFRGRYGKAGRCWVFVADKGWQEKTVMISLLSAVIREQLYVSTTNAKKGIWFVRYPWNLGKLKEPIEKFISWADLAKGIKEINPGVTIYKDAEYNSPEMYHNYNGVVTFISTNYNKYRDQVDQYYAS